MTIHLNAGTKIYIGIPCYNGLIDTWTTAGIVRLQKVCQAAGIPLTLDIHRGGSLIEVARNKIVRHFLESDCTHLVFIDADVGFFGDDILKLISHDKDICGGVYPRKIICWDNIIMAIRHYGLDIDKQLLEHLAVDYPFKPLNDQAQYDQLVEVCGLPTGFLAIKRTVFEKMFNSMRSMICDGQELREFFHVDAEGSHTIIRNGENIIVPEHISEDFWHCKRAKEHGFEIWLDPTINLYHTGSHTFKGSLVELAKLDKLDRESNV